jgi:hypothetical protein
MEAADMTRVIFRPVTNTQRSAVARFGTDWQLAHWSKLGHPVTVRGVPSVFIHPVGQQWEARWVALALVELAEPEADPEPTDDEMDAWAAEAEANDPTQADWLAIEALRRRRAEHEARELAGVQASACDRAQAAWDEGGREARLRAEAEPEWRQDELELDDDGQEDLFA